jgi:replicative DNA helicase
MTDEEILKIDRPMTATIGMEKFDRLFEWPAGFYLICGVSNVGKGFFSSWLATRFYKENGLKSVIFSLEMPESLIRDRCLQSWSGKTWEEYRDTGPTEEAINLLRKSIKVMPFNLYEKKTTEQFENDFNELYKQGIRCFFFDHLLELEGATENLQAQKVMQEWGKCFQEISKYHKDCWIIVFTQQRIEKQQKGKKDELSQNIVRMSDVQGPKSPIQKSDVFMGISRGRINEEDTRDFYIHVEKSRMGNSKFIIPTDFAPDGNFYSNEFEYEKQHKRVIEEIKWRKNNKETYENKIGEEPESLRPQTLEV